MLQIDEHKNKFAKNLSGGTLRKVSVANHLQPISALAEALWPTSFDQSALWPKLCGIATLQIN